MCVCVCVCVSVCECVCVRAFGPKVELCEGSSDYGCNIDAVHVHEPGHVYGPCTVKADLPTLLHLNHSTHSPLPCTPSPPRYEEDGFRVQGVRVEIALYIDGQLIRDADGMEVRLHSAPRRPGGDRYMPLAEQIIW